MCKFFIFNCNVFFFSWLQIPFYMVGGAISQGEMLP
jgi:hypothetical protein